MYTLCDLKSRVAICFTLLLEVRLVQKTKAKINLYVTFSGYFVHHGMVALVFVTLISNSLRFSGDFLTNSHGFKITMFYKYLIQIIQNDNPPSQPLAII